MYLHQNAVELPLPTPSPHVLSPPHLSLAIDRLQRNGAVMAALVAAGCATPRAMGGGDAWAERQQWRRQKQGDANQVLDEMPIRDVVAWS